MNIYCSTCKRKVIENGNDLSCWVHYKDEHADKYTCAFCLLGIEPNTTEAIVILGRYGKYPAKGIGYGHLDSRMS